MNDKLAEKINRLTLDRAIDAIIRLSPKMHQKQMFEAADRGYIEEYVSSCIKFLPQNPQILEFDGGATYGQKLVKALGGAVYFATKNGRRDRHNAITYEFDLRDGGSLPTKKFDVIIATQVIGSFGYPEDILRKLKSMLNPGGYLIVTTSGPAYPNIRGLVCFMTLEGLKQVTRKVFGNHIINGKTYGDARSAIHMSFYIKRDLQKKPEKWARDEFGHTVICGVLYRND